MSLEGCHIQIDDLQEQKLANDTWGDRDTALEDLANRSIDDFQTQIVKLPESYQERACVKLVDFLNSLGGDFNISDLQTLFDVLSPESTVEKRSLPNGLPMLRTPYDKETIQFLLEGLNTGETREILDYLHYEIASTKSGSEDSEELSVRGQDLEKSTHDFYITVKEELGISSEELVRNMVCGPVLRASLNNSEIQDFYDTQENKDECLACVQGQQAQLFVLRLWDFYHASPDQQQYLLSNNSDFANCLRRDGIPGSIYELQQCIENIEINEFSQSPEVIQKKAEIYDTIIENCNEEDISEVLAIYQIYLEYAGDTSQDVDSYLKKLGLFQDMLRDEFRGNWDITTFVARISSVGCRLRKFDGVLAVIQNIRRGREYLRKNALESSIIAASFCPFYVGSCIDMGYGALKLHQGTNFSGDAVPKQDAYIQIGFGAIGLGLDTFIPGGYTFLKALKASAKTSVEIQMISQVGKMIGKFIPELVKIFKKCEENLFLGVKELKDFFTKNIFPVIKDALQGIIQSIPQLRMAI